MNRHRFSFWNMSDTRRIHELSVSNYYFERFCIMTSLNIRRFDVIEWNYLKCIVTVDVNNIEHIVIIDSARYHKLIKFVNEDVNRVITAKILFRFSFHAKFSHDVIVIQYYDHRSRNFSWFEICIRTVDQKSFQNEQLFFLLFYFIRSFDKCKCLFISRRFNQLIYFYFVNKSNVETEMKETDEIIENSMKYILLSLHDLRLY